MAVARRNRPGAVGACAQPFLADLAGRGEGDERA
jgi:hypothetical protein